MEPREEDIGTTVLCGDQSKIVAEQWQIDNYQHPWKDLEREDAKRVACFYALSGFLSRDFRAILSITLISFINPNLVVG